MTEKYFDEIKQWLQSVSFKRAKFGGVDEADVWKKIDELNSLYEKALIAAVAESASGSTEICSAPADAGQDGVSE